MRAACAAASFPSAILLLLDGVQERVWNPQVFDLNGTAMLSKEIRNTLKQEGYGEDGMVSTRTAVAAEYSPNDVV